ncbi:hypothetical protein BUALT_Bualt07G0072700 [Buddleja alternifolia]|uniref:Remorin C-terminal domain-containing protein n=1 Tax=Buddleja alternifolia TaxID=168488 RepID=A0AAV6X855_9LAMI|nr:hypothetical protein BUALT_Bualt07G0072700 [Buddleja alternifolia]
MMRRSYELDESEFAVAIAASAHAIRSLDESRIQMTEANTRKQEPFRTAKPGSMRKPSIKDTRTSSFLRPTPSLAENPRQKETSRGHTNPSDSWEQAQIAKIRKRYERMHSEILSWENGKKLREKQHMERKKNELEIRKSRNLKHYESKLWRIDHIANGARAQVEEKRKQEESIVKQKARKMRSTGKAPVDYCFCF